MTDRPHTEPGRLRLVGCTAVTSPKDEARSRAHQAIVDWLRCAIADEDREQATVAQAIELLTRPK